MLLVKVPTHLCVWDLVSLLSCAEIQRKLLYVVYPWCKISKTEFAIFDTQGLKSRPIRLRLSRVRIGSADTGPIPCHESSSFWEIARLDADSALSQSPVERFLWVRAQIARLRKKKRKLTGFARSLMSLPAKPLPIVLVVACGGKGREIERSTGERGKREERER